MVESIDYDLDDSERDLISELEGIQLKINQIKGSALEQDDHDLLDDTQYVSQASMVEDSIASATAFRQNRVVDRLWSFCESTVGTSKLILADSLTIPFYMPIPKGPKPKTEVDVAREQARMEYIAKREIANRMAANGNNKAVLTTIPDRDASLNRRERYVQHRLSSSFHFIDWIT